MKKFPTEEMIDRVHSEIERRASDDGFFFEHDLKTFNVHSQHGGISALNVLGMGVSKYQMDALLSYQRSDGSFEGAGKDNYHHYCMIAIAINSTLGFKDVGLNSRLPFEADLAEGSFLANHDWTTTHKRLYAVLPYLITPREWHSSFVQDLDRNFQNWLLAPRRFFRDLSCILLKRKKLCKWEIISKLYHILMIHDFLGVPTEHDALVRDMMEAVRWDTEGGIYNNCTDFDYVKILDVLSYNENDRQEKIRNVIKRRIKNYEKDLLRVLKQNNHQIFAYLIGISVLQNKVPESFDAVKLKDVLHDITNYRMS